MFCDSTCLLNLQLVLSKYGLTENAHLHFCLVNSAMALFIEDTVSTNDDGTEDRKEVLGKSGLNDNTCKLCNILLCCLPTV